MGNCCNRGSSVLAFSESNPLQPCDHIEPAPRACALPTPFSSPGVGMTDWASTTAETRLRTRRHSMPKQAATRVTRKCSRTLSTYPSLKRTGYWHSRPGLNSSNNIAAPSVSLQAVSRPLNSLFKVLCNFPSRYLFAIGLVSIFSLTRSSPRIWAALPSNPTLHTHLPISPTL